jgi:hypothetical protein
VSHAVGRVGRPVVVVVSAVAARVVVTSWEAVDGDAVSELQAAATRQSAARVRESRDMKGENTEELTCE